MYSFIRKCRKFHLLADLQIELFRVTVLPVMLYGSEVWGHNVIRNLDILQMRYLKHVLCVNINTCNDIVYGEFGLKSIEVDIKVKIVSYWIRLITGRQEKIAYVMYQCSWHLDTAGLYTSSWLREIRSILNNCDFMMKPVCSTSVTFKSLFGREEYLTKLKTVSRIISLLN